MIPASTMPAMIIEIFSRNAMFSANTVACEVNSNTPEIALMMKPTQANLLSGRNAAGCSP